MEIKFAEEVRDEGAPIVYDFEQKKGRNAYF